MTNTDAPSSLPMPVVLVIDDDESIIHAISARLASRYQVVGTTDPRDAVAAATREQPDVILCDINMPTMDGIEFVRNLQGTESAWKVPVVMISTEGGEGRVNEAMSAGARGYISKPFTAEQLKAQILPLVEGQ